MPKVKNVTVVLIFALILVFTSFKNESRYSKADREEVEYAKEIESKSLIVFSNDKALNAGEITEVLDACLKGINYKVEKALAGGICLIDFEDKCQSRRAYLRIINCRELECEENVSFSVNANLDAVNEGRQDDATATELGKYLSSSSKIKSVTVALIDTAVDIESERLMEAKYYISDKPSFGHGSQMAEIILDDSSDMVAIKPYVVADDRGITELITVCSAIKDAINDEVNVINLSLNTVKNCKSKILESVIKEACDKGIVVVASAGNSGADTKFFTPSYMKEVITVSAVDDFNSFETSYSNYGDSVDYCAYGRSKYSMGSSNAAAMVSGLIAEGIASGMDLSGLEDYAIDLGKAGWDKYYGNGLLSCENRFVSDEADGFSKAGFDMNNPDWDKEIASGLENYKKMSDYKLNLLLMKSDMALVGCFLEELTDEELFELLTRDTILKDEITYTSLTGQVDEILSGDKDCSSSTAQCLYYRLCMSVYQREKDYLTTSTYKTKLGALTLGIFDDEHSGISSCDGQYTLNIRLWARQGVTKGVSGGYALHGDGDFTLTSSDTEAELIIWGVSSVDNYGYGISLKSAKISTDSVGNVGHWIHCYFEVNVPEKRYMSAYKDHTCSEGVCTGSLSLTVNGTSEDKALSGSHSQSFYLKSNITHWGIGTIAKLKNGNWETSNTGQQATIYLKVNHPKVNYSYYNNGNGNPYGENRLIESGELDNNSSYTTKSAEEGFTVKAIFEENNGLDSSDTASNVASITKSVSFSGWSCCDSTASSSSSILPSSEQTSPAYNTNLTFTADYTGDFKIRMPEAPTATGYRFVNWSTADGRTAAAGDLVDLMTYCDGGSEVTFYANWVKKNYFIEYDANGGKIEGLGISILKKSYPYNTGTDYTMGQYAPTCIAPEGKVFAGWNAKYSSLNSLVVNTSQFAKESFDNENATLIKLVAQYSFNTSCVKSLQIYEPFNGPLNSEYSYSRDCRGYGFYSMTNGYKGILLGYTTGPVTLNAPSYLDITGLYRKSDYAGNTCLADYKGKEEHIEIYSNQYLQIYKYSINDSSYHLDSSIGSNGSVFLGKCVTEGSPYGYLGKKVTEEEASFSVETAGSLIKIGRRKGYSDTERSLIDIEAVSEELSEGYYLESIKYCVKDCLDIDYGKKDKFVVRVNSAEDGYLKVYIKPCSYILNYDANGGFINDTDNTVFTVNDQRTLASKEIYQGQSYGQMPDAGKSGYKMKTGDAGTGWYTKRTGGQEVSVGQILEAASDITLYAHYEPLSVPIYFDAGCNGGLIDSNYSKSDTDYLVKDDLLGTSLTYGSSCKDLISRIKAKKEGYIFVGWSLDNSNSCHDIIEGDKAPLAGMEEITFYAIYKRLVTLNYYSGQDGEGNAYIDKVTDTYALWNNDWSVSILKANDIRKYKDYSKVGWTFDKSYAGTDVDLLEETGTYNLSYTWIRSRDWYQSKDTNIVIPVYAIYSKKVTLTFSNASATDLADIENQETSLLYLNITGAIKKARFDIIDGPVRDKYAFYYWKNITGNDGVKYQTVSHLNDPIVDTIEIDQDTCLLSVWDPWPLALGKDIYFTLEEAKNGRINENALVKGLYASDINYLGNKETPSSSLFTFDESIFVNLKNPAMIKVCFIVTDSFGSSVYAYVPVHIVDSSTKSFEDRRIRDVRFITEEFFKDKNGNFISQEKGGLKTGSIWKSCNYSDDSYEKSLSHALNNNYTMVKKDIFKEEEVLKIKEYILKNKSGGFGKYLNSDGLKGFISNYHKDGK